MPAFDKSLIGHAGIIQQLAQLLAYGVFPHAVLLHGPKGIGKRLLAEKLAARLMCGEGTADGLLNANLLSPVWFQLLAGSCPDFYVLEPEEGKKSVGIKQVQSLLESLQRSADTARVVIVDSLELLTQEACNTLLKTLEEPRTGIYFVLLAHQLSAVLPTIRSRCRLMKVSPLTEADVRKILRHEGVDEDFIALAHGAPGSVMGPLGRQRLELIRQIQDHLPLKPDAQGLVPVLMQHLATEPTLAHAERYFALAKLSRDAADMNLPAALVGETALKIWGHTDAD